MEILPIVADDKAGFCVRDNGIGIEEKYHEEVFKPLRRGSSTADMPGFGIGLSLVEKVIERHRGSIELTSKVDEGCTVVILLPSMQTTT